MDDLSLCGDELLANLDELEKLNAWFGSNKLLLRSLDRIYTNHSAIFHCRNVVIGDLGCGGGDLLRTINQWAIAKGITVELIGIDANQFMIDYAVKRSHDYPAIRYLQLDIFSPEFERLQFDIVTINSICHHFDDTSIIALLRKITLQTHFAIIINDLHRHWISYFSFKCISRIFRFSQLAKHDGALSILRAFQKQELANLLDSANIKSYQLHWRWAFRWEAILWLTN
jgi:2-polyprenyl-3-methyl-5-hydroxy-6-metoxy-1,4-benzoquinol methylase